MKLAELPRLTGSLRAFSGVSSPDLSNGLDSSNELVSKRQHQSFRHKENQLSWKQLKNLILETVTDDRNAKEEVGCVFIEYEISLFLRLKITV